MAMLFGDIFLKLGCFTNQANVTAGTCVTNLGLPSEAPATGWTSPAVIAAVLGFSMIVFVLAALKWRVDMDGLLAWFIGIGLVGLFSIPGVEWIPFWIPILMFTVSLLYILFGGDMRSTGGGVQARAYEGRGSPTYQKRYQRSLRRSARGR